MFINFKRRSHFRLDHNDLNTQCDLLHSVLTKGEVGCMSNNSPDSENFASTSPFTVFPHIRPADIIFL